ncbi:hypothetical protein TrRE_jg5756 [Triparma retinervis]|uniref:Uncharacterized protein n=1 Tax=Triparma retinervis TaxID=2557542 RepID=A0A9W7EBS3_9STRA|nr:hypothetical protein TrRE_jg5756 [Triparma retinervis]
MYVGIFPDLLPGSSVRECKRALVELLVSHEISQKGEWFDYKLKAKKFGGGRRPSEKGGCFILVIVDGMAKVLVEEGERRAGAECWRQLMKAHEDVEDETEGGEADRESENAEQGFRGIVAFRKVLFSDDGEDGEGDSSDSLSDCDGDSFFNFSAASAVLPKDAGFVEFTLDDGCVIKGGFLFPREVRGWEKRIPIQVEKRRERVQEKAKVRIVQMHRSKKDETSEVPEDVKNNYRTIAHPKYPPSALAPLSSGPELSDVIAHDGVDYMLLVASLVRDSRKYKHVWRSTCVENSGLFKRLCLLGEFQADPDDQLGQSPLKNVSNPREAVKVYTKQAEEAASSLFSLAKQICLKLNIDKLGIGPIKTEERALLKAKEKYNGDVRMVKDYSRCVIVCVDYTQLLAGLLLVHSRCAKVLVRLKTRALTRVNEALKGGYRHAVANVLLKGHVCEILFTTEDMYSICGTRGVRHYFHSMELYTDTLPDVSLLLKGSTSDERANMIGVIESRFPALLKGDDGVGAEIELNEYQVNVLYCLCHLLIHNKFYKWANLCLKKLLRIRVAEMPKHHPMVIEIKELLAATYQAQGLESECELVFEDVAASRREVKCEVMVQDLVSFVTLDNFLEMCEKSMDRVKEIRIQGRLPDRDSEYRFLFEQGTTYYNSIMVKQFNFLPLAKRQHLPKRRVFSRGNSSSVQEDESDDVGMFEFEKMFNW